MTRYFQPALLLFVFSCSSLNTADNSAGRLPADSSLSEVQEFRNIFIGAAGVKSGSDSASNLVFWPTPQMLREEGRTLRELGEAARATTPSALHRLGFQQASQNWTSDDVEAPLKKLNEALTIVIIPGIFSEFVKTRAFEELFADSAPEQALWQTRLAQFKSKNPNSAALSDPRFSLESMSAPQEPIENLVHVSGIRDGNGRVLANVVLMDAALKSLDSMGAIENRAEIFSRRLSKYFAIAGLPKHIVLLGYSRGTSVGLHMLAHAQSTPWFANVKGFVSLGGVIWGSDLADEAMNARGLTPAPTSAVQKQALEILGSSLQEIPEGGGVRAGIERLRISAANIGTWGSFLAKILPSLSASVKNGENSEESNNAFKQLISDASTASLAPAMKLVRDLAFHTFRLGSPVSNYNQNVRKMKHLINEVSVGVSQLSTGERMKWWKANKLPMNGIRYSSVVGVFTDDAELGANTDGFNAGSIDDKLLLTSYRDLTKASGMTINDSQVGYDKARFWPEFQKSLGQESMDFALWGLVGTHHWGLTLRSVNDQRAGVEHKRYNPFPRTALLKAIASMSALQASKP